MSCRCAESFRKRIASRLVLAVGLVALTTAPVDPVVAQVEAPAAPPVEQTGTESTEAAETLARGVVYLDLDQDAVRDADEPGVAGVGVSNGRQIVETDEQGRYEIPVDDDTIIWVIKPRDHAVPLDQRLRPQFYYVHKPNGSPPSRFPGVAPTGPLPESIDFPLVRADEPETFRALLFGDPQPRDQTEIDFIAHDVVEELVGTDASFGVTLGDILFDDLSLFDSQADTIALIGIPWYDIIGNHDINRDATTRRHANETFEAHYGPSYYSFDHGPVHFIALDDIDWIVPEDGSAPNYRAGLGAEQIEYVRQDLERVPDDRLVVLLMHIPLTQIVDRQELFRLIEPRKFCLSISGHTHHHEHRYVTEADGWRGAEPHHHVINVTVSGSWWSGVMDDRGIPHTTMADGAPNGYTIIEFDGTEYRLDYKAAGRPADYQMRITVAEQVGADEQATVWTNVFNGSERTTVELRIGDSRDWWPMTRSIEIDPAYAALYEKDRALTVRERPALAAPKPSPHLWKLALPAGLKPGTQLIHVRATDEQGRVFEACRVVRIAAPE